MKPNNHSLKHTQMSSDKRETNKTKINSIQAWFLSVWKFGKEDRSRLMFGFKVGLATLLVSLLTLIRTPYDAFGNDVIWSILTVVLIFEYTVGMTFSRGFNRAVGSLLAGLMAVSIAQLALLGGRIAQPIIIGLSIFSVGVVTSFMKQWPSLVQYEYGFRVSLFTFSLIVVSGYRLGNPIKIAIDRMYSIAIGAFVAVFVNVLIFPNWAGQQLHNELVESLIVVSDSIQECVGKYFEHGAGSELDEIAYRKCKDVINSSAKLDGMVSAAKWEPPHGKFNHLFYPWSEYLKVGDVLRYCAYEVMAIHGVLHSEIQAPYNLRILFQSEIKDTTNQAVELLTTLAKDVSNMKRGLHATLLKRLHSSTERLQNAMSLHSYLLTSPNSALTCSLLHQTSKLSEKSSRRVHSWPWREMDGFEGNDELHIELSPKMRISGDNSCFSVAMFSSLLVEFVARLDHLVDAVDELSRIAKFKDENV